MDSWLKYFFTCKILGILGIFEFFFICICNITCKPMGKFAENLNLGKHVLPPSIAFERNVQPQVSNFNAVICSRGKCVT